MALVVGLIAGNALHSDTKLRDQIAALQASVDRLTHDNASLKSANAGVQKRTSELQQENARLAAELKAKASLPKLVGKSRERVEALAADYGWRVVIARELESTKRVGTVLAQSPRAGTLMSRGKTLRIVVAKPPPVPNLVGKTVKYARAIAKRYGWTVFDVTEAFSPQPKGTILRQRPRPGARLPEFLPALSLVVSTGCDPNYAGGCLDPTALDYDCAGGSGDGPLYTGFVRVVGFDHYGLDRDDDGRGCE